MLHHTASPSTHSPAEDAAYIRNGGKGTYPPLAQIMLDRTGEVWMCSQERPGQASPGRASHAGEGSGFGVPNDSMNQYSLGIECQNDGTKPLASNPVMYEVLIRLLQTLSAYFKVPNEKIIGHKEWSSTGKPDPLDDMNVIRAHVRSEIVQPPEVPEVPEVPETPPSTKKYFIYHYSGKPKDPQTIGTGYQTITRSSFTPPGDGLLFVMQYANCAHTFKSGVTSAGLRIRVVREAFKGEPDDYSAYGDYTAHKHLTTPGTFLLTHVWFEMCEGGRTLHWEMDRSNQFSSFSLGTRYSKYVWISAEVLDALGRSLGLPRHAATQIVSAYLQEALVPQGDEALDLSEEPRTLSL